MLIKKRKSVMLSELRRLLTESEHSTENNAMVIEIETMIAQRVRFINKNSKYTVLPISSLVEFQVSCLVAALEAM